MKPNTAANLAMLFMPLGWVLAYYGAMSQLGDPSPLVSHAEIEAVRHKSMVILLAGILFMSASLWLSGFGFVVAKKRAVIVGVLCVLPILALTFGAI